MSNAAGVIGGSTGAFIGCFIGNLITPGVGGYVGSMIGGFISSAASSISVDYLMDPQSYTLEKYESSEVSDKEKYTSYLIACDTIQVSPHASKQKIKEEAHAQFKRFHPDKHEGEHPQEKEYYEKKFIQVRISYEFIKSYRSDKGTWVD